jgi:hypothetical protein
VFGLGPTKAKGLGKNGTVADKGWIVSLSNTVGTVDPSMDRGDGELSTGERAAHCRRSANCCAKSGVRDVLRQGVGMPKSTPVSVIAKFKQGYAPIPDKIMSEIKANTGATVL